MVYTHSGYLMVKWITGAGSNGHHGFSVSLTTISQDPGINVLIEADNYGFFSEFDDKFDEKKGKICLL